MKRRLDLALVHRPRILFLDEPTTGLDPQSRTALWEEVQRLASDRGVTVFLTTQYLEEADVLADRVGIIERAGSWPRARPRRSRRDRPAERRGDPQDPAELQHTKDVLSRFGESVAGSPKGASVRLAGGDAQLAEVVRALDSENIEIQTSCTRPRSTTSSGEDRPLPRGRGRRRAGTRAEPPREPGPAAGSPVGGADASPAGDGRAGAALPAAAAVDQQQRPRQRHAASRVSDRTPTSSSRSRSRSSRARSSPRTAPARTWRATSRAGS